MSFGDRLKVETIEDGHGMWLVGFPSVDVRGQAFEHQWREENVQGTDEFQADFSLARGDTRGVRTEGFGGSRSDAGRFR